MSRRHQKQRTPRNNNLTAELAIKRANDPGYGKNKKKQKIQRNRTPKGSDKGDIKLASDVFGAVEAMRSGVTDCDLEELTLSGQSSKQACKKVNKSIRKPRNRSNYQDDSTIIPIALQKHMPKKKSKDLSIEKLDDGFEAFQKFRVRGSVNEENGRKLA